MHLINWKLLDLIETQSLQQFILIIKQSLKSTMPEINEKVQKLTFTYRQYMRNNQSLEGVYIGPYKVQRQLGKGAFGNIYYAENQNKQSFALKLLDLVSVKEERNPKIKQIRQRLVKSQPGLMQLCNSPNVLKCYDIFQNQDLKILVLEYCNGRTLEQYIKKKKRIPEEEAVPILRQIINGLAELHKNRVVHRDLKAENIMEHEGCYKIIDLGFSKKLDIINQTAQVQGTTLGTVITMAPEVMSRKNYGLKADIWSIGVIFFQMIFGEMPYDSVNAKKRYEQIEKKQYFNPNNPLTINKVTASKEASDFFSRVFQVDTEKRMDWRQLLQHQLIKQKKEQPLCPRFWQKPATLQQPKVHKSLIEQTLQQGELPFQILNQCEQQQQKEKVPLPIQNSQDIVNPKTRFDDLFKNTNPKICVSQQKQKRVLYQRNKQGQTTTQTCFDDYQKNKLPIIRKEEQEQKDIVIEKQNLELQMEVNRVQPVNQRQNLQLQINANRVQSVNQKQKQPRETQQQNYDCFKFETQQYRWCKQGYLQCLKTELIYRKIILPIQETQILNLNNREVIELMFLLSARCFNNMSPISWKIQNQKDKSNNLVKNLYEQVRPLYQQVLETFKKYSQKLTSVENKFINIVKDFFFRKLVAKEYEKKDKMTTGLENEQKTNYVDYSKNQQISYTFDSYISKLLPKITSNSIASTKVKILLKNYEKLNFVTLEQLDGKDYQEYVKKIMDDYSLG